MSYFYPRGKILTTFVDDVTYTEKDVRVRKGQAWKALNKLARIWKSDLSGQRKSQLFVATVESVLLYGCEAWTLTKAMEKSLDGMYTRMLRMVHGVSGLQKMTNTQLYGGLPKLSTKIQARRLKLAGHLLRHSNEAASNLITWRSNEGKARQGAARKTYVDLLEDDTGLTADEINRCARDRHQWRVVIDRLST